MSKTDDVTPNDMWIAAYSFAYAIVLFGNSSQLPERVDKLAQQHADQVTKTLNERLHAVDP